MISSAANPRLKLVRKLGTRRQREKLGLFAAGLQIDDNVAVGLLFAGSSVATIVNQIENVRSLLRVEVAQQVL